MSKVDAMRALKQARLEQQRQGAAARPAAAAPPARPAPEPDLGSCGHRNIGGRSCTRASGHAEKSHRYA